MAQALVGKEVSDLEQELAARGRPAFRARQLYHGLYRRRWTQWDHAAVLPKDLRTELSQDFELGLPSIVERIAASDGTVRYLLGLADGKSVEAVFIPEDDRDTLCISSVV